MRSLELFAGAGGLAIGAHKAGFRPAAVIEWDKWACDTIRRNQAAGNKSVHGWHVHQCDVRQFSFDELGGDFDLISGGPPCQPFSLGGRHRAHLDDRDMFPPTIRAIRELQPKAFIIENVKGLTRRNFSEYLQYILLQLENPDIVTNPDEPWTDHLARLEKRKTAAKVHPPRYEVVFRVLNAANYGVPQKRERIFFVGFRHDLGIEWSFPEPSHSHDALLHDQWVSGEYWDRNEVSKSARPKRPERMSSRIEQLTEQRPSELPWMTVRQAIQGLPSPHRLGKSEAAKFSGHKYQAGAKVYPGHTGSPIDEPAKTLKAGVHGVPGGENMIRFNNGSVRYFTVREAARLQTFADDYEFHGSWTEVMRQLGNAVPVNLASVVANSVATALNSVNRGKKIRD